MKSLKTIKRELLEECKVRLYYYPLLPFSFLGYILYEYSVKGSIYRALVDRIT